MNNMILIGMPASGKSTVGVIAAKMLGMDFMDTDIVLQKRENKRISDIISEIGVEGFLRTEEEAVLSVDANNTIIATGGSVIYKQRAMDHLASLGILVYLKVDKDSLFQRLSDIQQRGVVLREGQSLDEMFAEREKLYQKYANYSIDETGLSVEGTVAELVKYNRIVRQVR